MSSTSYRNIRYGLVLVISLLSFQVDVCFAELNYNYLGQLDCENIGSRILSNEIKIQNPFGIAESGVISIQNIVCSTEHLPRPDKNCSVDCDIYAGGRCSTSGESQHCSVAEDRKQCSVVGENDIGEARCSVYGNSNKSSCSVFDTSKENTFCSAWVDSGRASCSVQEGSTEGPPHRNSCSVLESTKSAGQAGCSVVSWSKESDQWCSVDNAGEGGKANCSVGKSRTRIGSSDMCSVFMDRGEQQKCSVVQKETEEVFCSVFSNDSGNNSSCSVFHDSPLDGERSPECSAIDSDGGGMGVAKCSVQSTQTGEARCSIEKGAFDAFCSVMDGGGSGHFSNCSIMQEANTGQCSVFTPSENQVGKKNNAFCSVEDVGKGICTLLNEEKKGVCSIGNNQSGEAIRCSVRKTKKVPDESGTCGREHGYSPPHIVSPPDYLISNDSKPEIIGTVEVGFNCKFYIDSIEIEEISCPSGQFEYETEIILQDGEHVIFAIGVSPEGVFTEPSNYVHIIIDTVIGTPIITSPANGSVISDNTPDVVGSGTDVGALVHVYVDGDLVGLVTANEGGGFNMTVPTALGDGLHTGYAVATDAAGNTAASKTVSFTVDTLIGTPILNPIELTNDSTPTISGAGTDSDAEIAIVVDENLAGTTTTGPGGVFSFTLTAPLAEGLHTVYAVASDGAGNTATSETIVFKVDTVPPAAPLIRSPVNGEMTTKTPIIRGTSEPLSIVSILIDANPEGETPADGGGLFSFQVVKPLSPGWHTIHAQARDAAGNLSPISAGVEFFADPPPPPANNDKSDKRK